MMRSVFGAVFLLLISLRAGAQTQEVVNQRDAEGRLHGFCYVKHPERMGDPAFTEFGSYDHGRKYGIWHILSSDGQLMASQRYKNNTLDGESRYYENGRLTTIGNYRGMNPDQPFDTLWVKDPVTGYDKKVVISTDRGSTKHGTWQYFDPLTGRLKIEEEYQVDELIRTRKLGVAKEDSTAYLQRAGKLPHNSASPARAKPTRLIER